MFRVEDFDPVFLEFCFVDRGVVSVTSKAIYGVHKNNLELTSFGILNHALKISTIVCLT